jgi:hypothetical protein
MHGHHQGGLERPAAGISDDIAGHTKPATTLIYYHKENRVKDPVETYINMTIEG